MAGILSIALAVVLAGVMSTTHEAKHRTNSANQSPVEPPTQRADNYPIGQPQPKSETPDGLVKHKSRQTKLNDRSVSHPNFVPDTQTVSKPGGVVVGTVSTGPCSVVQIGGTTNTATGGNCGPPAPKIIWKLERAINIDGRQDYPRETGVFITLKVDHSLDVPAFRADCDRPCKTSQDSDISMAGAYMPKVLIDGNSQNATAFFLMTPRPLGPEVLISWYIEGIVSRPQILSVSIIPRESIPGQ